MKPEQQMKLLNEFCKGMTPMEADKRLAKYQRMIATRQLDMRMKVMGLQIGG